MPSETQAASPALEEEAVFETVLDADFGGEMVIEKPCPAGTYRVRRRTSTKRKVTNALITSGIGAAIGGGVAGGRGALVGLGSGAGGYLLYRYVRDSRGRCVRRYVRG